MNTRYFKLWVCGALLAPGLASAALGEPEATVRDDAVKLRGELRSTAHAGYRVHEIQLPSGTALREYATLDGQVFAVAWNGPAIPNLSQALGGYFTRFTGAAKERRAGRSPLAIRQEDFVMESNGHMRAFTGRAYLPRAVPAGTSPDEIR